MEIREYTLKVRGSDLSWIEAALASYVAENEDREDDYYRLSEQISELLAEENEAEAKEEEPAPEDPTLIKEELNSKDVGIDVDDYDIDEFSSEWINGWISGTVDKKDSEYILGYKADCYGSVEVDWEADGSPTYVPYGNQSVLYDDGRGGIDSVEVDDCEVGDIEWTGEDDVDLSEDEAKALLKVTDEEYKQLLGMIAGAWQEAAQAYAENNTDALEEQREYSRDDYEWRMADDAYDDRD